MVIIFLDKSLIKGNTNMVTPLQFRLYRNQLLMKESYSEQIIQMTLFKRLARTYFYMKNG